jgi:hypothetical protein
VDDCSVNVIRDFVALFEYVNTRQELRDFTVPIRVGRFE